MSSCRAQKSNVIHGVYRSDCGNQRCDSLLLEDSTFTYFKCSEEKNKQFISKGKFEISFDAKYLTLYPNDDWQLGKKQNSDTLGDYKVIAQKRHVYPAFNAPKSFKIKRKTLISHDRIVFKKISLNKTS